MKAVTVCLNCKSCMEGQRVLNAAARVVSDTKKFDQGLTWLMHQELHWLDIPERMKYKLGMLTHRCLLGKAPVYPSNCCIPVAHTTASTLHCTSSADRTSTSSQHRSQRSAGICCRWSDNVQCSARWSTRSCSQHNNIRTNDEDTPFLCLSARLAH